MKNFSAPQKFRVIDTETGSIVDEHKYIAQSGDLVSRHHNKIMTIALPNHISSASIGMKDSKGVEIFAGDILNDGDGGLFLVLWNKNFACYQCYALGSNVVYRIVHDTFVEEDTIIGNIWQPEYKKYLDQLE